MKRFMKLALTVTIFSLALFSISFGQNLKPEELIANHLNSIAPAGKRAEVKSIVFVGNVRFTNITRKSPPTYGSSIFASEGEKTYATTKLNASDSPSENIVFDGSKATVSNNMTNQRTLLGTFLLSNNKMIEEGLLFGVLTTNWALSNAEIRDARMTVGRGKKVAGFDTYSLRYIPKGAGNLTITMYFDRENYRHLRTEYSSIFSAAMGSQMGGDRNSSINQGARMDQSARNQETRVRITEDFADFSEIDGFNIPTSYNINYTVTGQNGTTELKWEYEFQQFGVNQEIDDSIFK